LFGDILSVTGADVIRTLAIAIVVLFVVFVFYRELLFYTFDPLAAQAMGLPITWIQVGLNAAITLAILASMQAVGVVLVVALLIGPAITAYLLVKELYRMMLLGAALSVLASISGLYVSYYWNIPSGAAIVLVVCLLFLLALLFSPSQGILTRPKATNRSAQRLFKQLRQN
jgi:manganese/iron transport system permease protein